jgi:hypothetical protein
MLWRLQRRNEMTPCPLRTSRKKKNKQAGLVNRPDHLRDKCVANYAMRLLRKIRSVLMPNGSSSIALATIVAGSGTTSTTKLCALPAPVPQESPASPQFEPPPDQKTV